MEIVFSVKSNWIYSNKITTVNQFEIDINVKLQSYYK